MKKMKILIGFLLVTFAVACGQKADDTFLKPMYFNFGLSTTEIIFSDGTSMNTAPIGIGSITWDAILNKPLIFPPAIHNHSTLYRPLTWVPVWGEISEKPIFFSGSYTDLTDKPGTIELAEAISSLGVLVIPKKTTAEIALLSPTAGSLVYDVTLNVLKLSDGVKFKVLITNN